MSSKLLQIASLWLIFSTSICAAPVDAHLLSGLSWRSIGPAMFGGRVDDVAGVPGNPNVLFVAHSTGGLWKSVNGGTTFESVFNDGNTLSVGAVAIMPGNPQVIYIGTGEGFPRNSISFGDGIYKSTNGGKTWTNVGLKDSQRFSRIVVNPQNTNIILAAAMGHAFGPNSERGIYKSSDAGATWKRVLYVDETTGASDVCLDPKDPNIVYAGMYDYQRKPWNFRSGGPGSGLYRSSDGGETWTKLTDPKLHNGLPGAKLIGRIGISVSYSNPNVVYAIIEAQEPGVLWRSSDRGLHWTLVYSNRNINNRPFYYSQVRADPSDENRVFTLSGTMNVSDDGGHTFRQIPGASIFGDHHAMWIDPLNSKRILSGTDGGFFISNDGGDRWDFINNMPMAQAYHVGVDMAEPYNVMGGFQDHEIWRGPNERWNEVGVREGDWRRLRNMADGMYALPDPRDPNIVYYNGHFGDITRIDLRNTEEGFIQPWPVGPAGGGANMDKYRFNWNSPIHMSPTNPDVVYYGGNVLFKTTNGGQTWTAISPDLTTNDPEKQKLSGGPITPDNTRAEFYCTIVSISESPKDSHVIWAGTDDGNAQLTRDGGAHWTNVAPDVPGLPRGSWIQSIQASPSDAGTAYLVADDHLMDDFHTYAYMTSDYGKTWKSIGQGLNGYAHIVMEDPKEANLLYAGTELGVFASFDRGESWTDLRLGLPHLPVVDMKVHPRDNDLIIATHARGFYILDDATPLQQLAIARNSKVKLFQPIRAIRYVPASDTSVLANRVWVAKNKPYGAVISYYLSSASSEPVQLSILDANGRTRRNLSGPGKVGINRLNWDLREAACPASTAAMIPGRGRRGGTGPRVLPGEYRVRLQALGEAVEEPVQVKLDPRLHLSPQDLDDYWTQVQRLYTMQCSIDQTVASLEQLKQKLKALDGKKQNSELASLIANAQTELSNIEDDFESPPQDPEHLNIRRRLTWLVDQVSNHTARPTRAQIEQIGVFEQETHHSISKVESFHNSQLRQLNEKLQANGLAVIQ